MSNETNATPAPVQRLVGHGFCCPKCGSHMFGSTMTGFGRLIRHCHGKDGHFCDFMWPECDDHLYMPNAHVSSASAASPMKTLVSRLEKQPKETP